MGRILDQLAATGVLPPGPTSSRNGGRNHRHMAFVRAARKARNVKRHRAHMKGK